MRQLYIQMELNMLQKINLKYQMNSSMQQYPAVNYESPKSCNVARSPYKKISNELRQIVIQEICVQGQSLRKTAEKHGLKYSTVKGIVQIYQAFGRSSKKDRRNRKYFLKAQHSLVVVEQDTGSIALYGGEDLSQVVIISENGDHDKKQLNSSVDGNFTYINDKQCLEDFVSKEVQLISKQIEKMMWHDKILQKGSQRGGKIINEYVPAKNINSGKKLIAQNPPQNIETIDEYFEEFQRNLRLKLQLQLEQSKSCKFDFNTDVINIGKINGQQQVVFEQQRGVQEQFEYARMILNKQFELMKIIK